MRLPIGHTTTGVSWTPAHTRQCPRLCATPGGTRWTICVPTRTCPAIIAPRLIWGHRTCRRCAAATSGTPSPSVRSVSDNFNRRERPLQWRRATLTELDFFSVQLLVVNYQVDPRTVLLPSRTTTHTHTYSTFKEEDIWTTSTKPNFRYSDRFALPSQVMRVRQVNQPEIYWGLWMN